MNTIFKVRHKPSGRFLTGSNYPSQALRLTGKAPVGKIWNFYTDARKYSRWVTRTPFSKDHLDPNDLEIVEYRLVEESTTPVEQ